MATEGAAGASGQAAATPRAGTIPGSAPIVPADNFRKADVPASNGTTSSPNIATVHRPEGETVNVTQFTVHNWVEAVYKAMKIPFPTGVWETATLGVREASMLSKGVVSEDDVVKSEQLAGQGKTSAAGGNGTAKMGETTREKDVKLGVNTKFDDALYIVWTESNAAQDQKVEVFQCTVDPAHTTNKNGHPFLLEGYEYQLVKWTHLASKYKNLHKPGSNAYQVRDKGPKETTAILRTKGKRVIATNADVTSGKSSIVRHESGVGINVHFKGMGADPAGEQVGKWSAGCTVLRHGQGSARYKRFAQIINKSKDKPRPYLIVSSQYVRLYHEWVDYCKGDKQKAQDPKSVLKEDALKERELNGKYIPSVLDINYAKANPAKVSEALFSTAK
jgi:hypothetical protein